MPATMWSSLGVNSGEVGARSCESSSRWRRPGAATRWCSP